MSFYRGRLDQNRPYKGIEAVIYPADPDTGEISGERVDVDVTNEKGLYFFSNLDPGPYVIRFFGGNYTADDAINVNVVESFEDGRSPFGYIEIDQQANHNGWFNQNITWRIVFDEDHFTAEYKVWADETWNQGTCTATPSSGEPGSWTSWGGVDQTITQTGNWTIKVRLTESSGVDPSNIIISLKLKLEVDNPTWPGATADIDSGFGAIRLENMNTDQICSFSGGEVIQVRLNESVDNYGTSFIVDEIPKSLVGYQYSDILPGDYYVYLDVLSLAGNTGTNLFSDGVHSVLSLTPSNLNEELTIISSGVNQVGNAYELRYGLSNRIDTIELITNPTATIEAVEYYNISSDSWQDTNWFGSPGSRIDNSVESATPNFATTAGQKHIVEFDKVETTGVRIQLDSPGNTIFFNPVESLAAETFVGETFEAQRGISFIAVDDTERIAIDQLGIRGWEDYNGGAGTPSFELLLSSGGKGAGYFKVGDADNYAEWDPDTNTFLVKGTIEATSGLIGGWTISDPTIEYIHDPGGTDLGGIILHPGNADSVAGRSSIDVYRNSTDASVRISNDPSVTPGSISQLNTTSAGAETLSFSSIGDIVESSATHTITTATDDRPIEITYTLDSDPAWTEYTINAILRGSTDGFGASSVDLVSKEASYDQNDSVFGKFITYNAEGYTSFRLAAELVSAKAVYVDVDVSGSASGNQNTIVTFKGDDTTVSINDADPAYQIATNIANDVNADSGKELRCTLLDGPGSDPTTIRFYSQVSDGEDIGEQITFSSTSGFTIIPDPAFLNIFDVPSAPEIDTIDFTQYEPVSTFTPIGLYLKSSPNLETRLGGGYENLTISTIAGGGGSAGGGSTVVAWPDITNKPFESVDTSPGQFVIVSGILQLSASATPDWTDVTNKPFTTVNTSTGQFVISSDELQLPQNLGPTSDVIFDSVDAQTYLKDGDQVITIASGTSAFYANVYAGRNAGSGTTEQTAIGASAGNSNSGLRQTVLGYNAGSSNTEDDQTAIGHSAGIGNTGDSQTVAGFEAGSSNVGNYQTAFGYRAGFNNSNIYQTAVGYLAGNDNSGTLQVAIGQNAGRFNSGPFQTAIGSGAGTSNTQTSQTAIGANAGNANTGFFQTAIGTFAGRSNSGNYNTSIGYSSGDSNSGDNTIFLGHEAGDTNTENNVFILHHNQVSSTPLLKGDLANGRLAINSTDPEGFTLNVNGTTQLKQSTQILQDITTDDYVSGVLGVGATLDNLATGGSFFEVDNMRVRKNFRTHIFVKDQVRATNGLLYISDASEVAEEKTFSVGQTGVTLDIKAGSGYATFQNGDDLVVKNLAPDLSSSNQIEFSVTNVDTTDPDFTRLTVNVINGTSGTVYEGDTIVRTSGGTILLDAETTNAPFIDTLSSGSVKARMGNLTGAPQLSNGTNPTGFGLWGDNVFLEGTIVASSGQIGGWTIDSNSLFSGGIYLHENSGSPASDDEIRISSDGSGGGTINYVRMFYDGAASDTWGIEGVSSGNEVFFLGEKSGVVSNSIGGWSFDEDSLYSSNGSYNISLGFPEAWSSSLYGLQIGSDASNRIWIGVTNSYYEIRHRFGGNDIFILGSQSNQIAGWNFDQNALWTGTKDTSGYTSGGITLSSSGTIHTPDFYVDGTGAFFRGTLSAPDGSLGNLTIANTLTMGTTGEITNSNADYTIDEDGVFIASSTGGTFDPLRAIHIGSSAQIWANSTGNLRIRSFTDDVVQFSTGLIRITQAALWADGNDGLWIGENTSPPSGEGGRVKLYFDIDTGPVYELWCVFPDGTTKLIADNS